MKARQHKYDASAKQTKKALVYGVVQNGVLIRRLKHSKHYFYKYGGYGFGKDFLKRIHFESILITEEDTGKKYTVTRTDFDKHSQEVTTSFGTQLVLNIQYFTEISTT